MGLSMYLSKSTYVEKVTMNNKTKKTSNLKGFLRL